MFEGERPEVGHVYEHGPMAALFWPESGPFILLRQVGSTSTWEALDVACSGVSTIVPDDDLLYVRIA